MSTRVSRAVKPYGLETVGSKTGAHRGENVEVLLGSDGGGIRCIAVERTPRVELPGRWPRGRAVVRFMDAVKEDRKLVGVKGTRCRRQG